MSQKWDYIAKIVSLGDSGCGKSSLTIRLCEGRFVNQHDVTIGVEFGSRVVPVGPPASKALGINDPSAAQTTSATSSTAAAVVSNTTTTTTGTNTQQQKQQQKQLSASASAAAPAPRQQHMKLSLWDTAGQETYKSITRSYFRGASGALLVFDITRRQTFHSATTWLNDLRQIAEDGIVVVLVGNKSDLAPESTVGGDDPAAADAGTETSQPQKQQQQENKRQVTRAEAEDWCRQNKVMRYVETSAKSGDGVERAFLEVAERIFQNIQAGVYDLNDRRSGVKSAAASSSSSAAAAAAAAANPNKAIYLTGDDNGNSNSGRACC